MLIHSILQEIGNVTDEQIASAEPSHIGCRHDHVVGELSHELRQLAFVWRQYGIRSAQLRREFESGQTDEGHIRETKRFMMVTELLRQLFWASVNSTFPEMLDKQLVGLRPGWKVVWVDHSTLATEVPAGVAAIIVDAGMAGMGNSEDSDDLGSGLKGGTVH